jgi:hypothetical protein
MQKSIATLKVRTQMKRKTDLTRMFYTGSSRGAANPDSDKEGDGLRRRLCKYTLPKENLEINVATHLFADSVEIQSSFTR